MITAYVHQPVEKNPNDPHSLALPKGVAEIPLADIDKIGDAVVREVVTFILPINRRQFLLKNLNQWIYNFLLLLKSQEESIAAKAQKGDPGKDGVTPSTAQINQLIAAQMPTGGQFNQMIAAQMPKVPVVRAKRLELRNIAVGLKEIPVNWDAPFDSANYTPVCTVEATATGLLQLDSIAAGGKTKNGFVARVKNVSVAVQSGTLNCIAVAD